uniref:Knottin scorpion toxin-like domain-containing protein n=1 Tax=Oryza punctata TaxID=4537 RepID=A0A0E0MJZ9_ORYPU
MAPVKINKTIAATFFMVLVIMSYALTSTSACRGWTECTVEEPHCTMDSCREKCKTEATSRKCNRMTASCHKYARPEKCCCYFYPK